MNLTENLLTTLSEEAGEVILHTSKSLRFGLHDGYPGSTTTNAQDIAKEIEELNAVYQILVSRGDLPKLSEQQIKSIRDEKIRRVEEFQNYSRNLGCLSGGKRVIFRPDNESTYPPAFRWVKTNIGIGYHAFLSEAPDETYDNWHFIFDNKDEPTLSIGLGTDNTEIEVEWWEPIFEESNYESKQEEDS